ncbi:MAG: glycerol-3-phosphate 1-O-acyltransferase PlsY [Proteobacteria bacterium]|nr:glycerol-3-phosphate 1-O-acyltransferase PlsY [Pseudomonadota bacterium]
MNDLLMVAGAYLLGSISFAVVVSRAFALPDPHTYGSKSPGATNVLRTGNKAAAALTLLGDAGKGLVAVLAAKAISGEDISTSLVVPLAGLAAFTGHLFPVFHRFLGGKGVATAAGVLLGYSWWLGAGTLATWLIIAVFFRISSFAALVAAVFAPCFAFMLFGAQAVTWATIPMALLLMLRHRANIGRLLAGTEPRIGAMKKPAPESNQ